MSFAFPATWQTFRLGLHVSPTGRAAYSTLRTAIGASNLTLSGVDSRHGFLRTPWRQLRSSSCPDSIQSITPSADNFRRQSRWVAFWKPPPEKEVPGEVTGENQLSLSPDEVEEIFGRKIDPEEGVEILMTLQKHRSEGTLDYEMPYSSDLIAKGLAYLRSANPVDEDAAIIARIDREADRLPQTDVERSPHAVSQFERLRQANKEKREREEAEREAEEKKKSEREGPATPKQMEARSNKATATSNDLVKLRREPEWVRNYREKATNQDEAVKSISIWARLLPSAAFTVSVVVLSVLFAQNYTPPSRKARLWPDIPPAAATMITIIGLNCFVFVLWIVPPLWKFMSRNFLVVPVYPYPMSMIGASFSQQTFTHLSGNVLFLWLVGTRVHDDIGRGRFLAVYFSSAVISAYIPMLVYVSKNVLVFTTLGASGCTCALLSTLFVLHEGRNITFPSIPPEWTRGIDTALLLALCMLLEIVSLRKSGIHPTQGSVHGSKSPRIDHMGHLAGYVSGIGAGAIIRYTDPKWGNMERHHFFTRDFGKGKKQPSSQLAPSE